MELGVVTGGLNWEVDTRGQVWTGTITGTITGGWHLELGAGITNWGLALRAGIWNLGREFVTGGWY